VSSRLPSLAGSAPAAVPVGPDAETARRWMVEELSEPIYDDRPSLLDLVLQWIGDRLAELSSTAWDVDPRAAALVVVGVVAVAVAVALVVAGPVRRARRGDRASAQVLADETRTAAELGGAADATAARGDWSGAVLDRFRAVLRSLEERAVLDERAGRTAHEASSEAGDLFPRQAVTLRAAGDLFDDVCYGDVEADADDDARLRALDEALRAERPTRSRTSPALVGGEPSR
jgi:hypothetical protein